MGNINYNLLSLKQKCYGTIVGISKEGMRDCILEKKIAFINGFYTKKNYPIIEK